MLKEKEKPNRIFHSSSLGKPASEQNSIGSPKTLMMLNGWCDLDAVIPCRVAAPLWLRRRNQKARVDTALGELGEKNEAWPKEEEKEDRPILCRACRHPVTSSGHGMEVNGSHHHTFPNPLGIVFQIGCFAMASGCIRQGRATGEFSWFPGFNWCFALCANCYAHLGWHYSSGSGRSFYGLITGQLLGNG